MSGICLSALAWLKQIAPRSEPSQRSASTEEHPQKFSRDALAALKLSLERLNLARFFAINR